MTGSARVLEVIPKKRLQLFAGRTNAALAEEVASILHVELGHANIVDFANGAPAKAPG